MIRVLIAAPSPVLRAGLEAVVRSAPELEFAGACSPGDAEERAAAAKADVLLVESNHLDREWLRNLAAISLPAVILTETTEPAIIASALRSGVRSVLASDAGSAEIDAALTAAAIGLVTLQQATLDQFLAEMRPAPSEAPAELEEPLSRRELEVLAMLAEGLSNKLIAHRLGISDHTVKFHVTSIMGKLHAGSRTDAVMQAVRRGLVML